MGSDLSDEDSSRDWRDDSSYDPLFALDRAAIDLAFARRHADFLARPVAPVSEEVVRTDPPIRVLSLPDILSGGSGGLPFAEPEDDGLAFWRADRDPLVLQAWAVPAGAGKADLDLLGLPMGATVLREGRYEHVLIADGVRQLRMQLCGVSVLSGPVALEFRHRGLEHMRSCILALERLTALWRWRRFPAPLFRVDPVVARWVRALRALDARRAGAGQRDIVIAVLGEKFADERSFDSSRKTVARLLRLAEQRLEMGWRRFR